ncbi:uncharacterized protein LOC126316439 isoform X2 [Schistocerca gregaria]|uniref:uncharacterized protein LOC126316439 isoform X2 n=1 Tax=Schistocerca gregaria TaxID=7010 RepID=UPI00211DE0DC|nr:uncharacterized protein LOC126316439 isoform X2 [Schistocerca gregaria]
MPVRGLEAYLRENGLIRTEPIASLAGMRVGVDATHWLKTRIKIKEVFQVATGGAPLGLRAAVDADVALFKRNKISPLWVFNGLLVPKFQLTPNVDMRMNMRMEAWNSYLSGHPAASKSKFEASLSDKSLALSFSGLVFWHLLNSNEEIFRAPMLPWPQLTYFLEPSQRQHPGHAPLINAVYGPTEVLATGASSLILSFRWEEGVFEWTELTSVLRHSGLSYSQFQDACILAGFDACPSTIIKNANILGFEAYVKYVKQAEQRYREQMEESAPKGAMDLGQGGNPLLMEMPMMEGQQGPDQQYQVGAVHAASGGYCQPANGEPEMIDEGSNGTLAQSEVGAVTGSTHQQVSDRNVNSEQKESPASPASINPMLFPVTHPELYLSVLHDANRMMMFRRAKILINHHLVLSQSGTCAPENRALISVLDPDVDMDQILGKPIPNEAYWLLSRGCIGAQVMNNLLSGVMLEAPPLISSPAYEAYLEDLLELRERTLALVSAAIGGSYMTLDVVMVRWFAENKVLRHVSCSNYVNQLRDPIAAQEIESNRRHLIQQARKRLRQTKASSDENSNRELSNGLTSSSDQQQLANSKGPLTDTESLADENHERFSYPSAKHIESMLDGLIRYLMLIPSFQLAVEGKSADEFKCTSSSEDASKESGQTDEDLTRKENKAKLPGSISNVETEGKSEQHPLNDDIPDSDYYNYYRRFNPSSNVHSYFSELCLTFVLQLIFNKGMQRRTLGVSADSNSSKDCSVNTSENQPKKSPEDQPEQQLYSADRPSKPSNSSESGTHRSPQTSISNKSNSLDYSSTESSVSAPSSSAPSQNFVSANELYYNVVARALELSGYVSPHYSSLTYWGYALHLIDPIYIESGFVVLELLKSKRLNSAQLIPNPLDEDLEPELILSTRIFSLLHMQLCQQGWSGPIDQDLLAFNSLIRACFRTLRNLFEMVSLNFVLNRCIQARAADYQLVSRQLLWVQEASTALGMVFKALVIEGPIGLGKRFSSCLDLKRDLYRGVAFWKSVYLAISYLSEVNQIDLSTKKEFDRANVFVLQQERIIPSITA